VLCVSGLVSSERLLNLRHVKVFWLVYLSCHRTLNGHDRQPHVASRCPGTHTLSAAAVMAVDMSHMSAAAAAVMRVEAAALVAATAVQSVGAAAEAAAAAHTSVGAS